MEGALHPFIGRDLPWLLDRQAILRPDAAFLIWEPASGDEQRFSYETFATETRRLATGLAERGVKLGDLVLIHLDNCPEFLLAWYACSRLGAVAVTTNTRSTLDELSYFAAHSGATVAITQPKYAALVRTALPAWRWIGVTETDGGERPVDALADRVIVPFDRLRGREDAFVARKPDPLLPNSVQYTSGTTARPKGVVWTHANALWSAQVNATHARLSAADVNLFYFPLFHSNALAWSVLGTLGAGGTAVMTPKFSASRFWRLSEKHGCTWTNMVMFTLRALAAQPDPARHSYRFWGCAGDLSLPRSRWGIKTIGWFGMTETISQCTVSDFDAVGPEGSMGRPAPEYGVALRRDDGSPAEAGEVANLWIRGQRGVSLFAGYLHNEEAAAASFDSDGWFETGDQARLSEDGNMFFAGRAKDMLRIGAENVAAIEIEQVIARVPGVVEVAVVGKPDPMLDEVPVAFVVGARGDATLRARIDAACADLLSSFKRPADIIFLDALPKGLLDKVLKNQLRASIES